MNAALYQSGIIPHTAGRHLEGHSTLVEAATEYLQNAQGVKELVDRYNQSDPMRIVLTSACSQMIGYALFPTWAIPEITTSTKELFTIDMLKEYMEGYSYEIHFDQMMDKGAAMDQNMVWPPSIIVAMAYGDIPLCRLFLEKVCSVFETVATPIEDPNLHWMPCTVPMVLTNHVHRLAGLHPFGARLMKASGMTYHGVEHNIEHYWHVWQSCEWDLSESKGLVSFKKDTIIWATKLAHCLILPEELSEAEIAAVLPRSDAMPTASEVYDITRGCWPSSGLHDGMPELLEWQGRLEDAVHCARIQAGHFPHNPFLQAYADLVVGRVAACHGNWDQAEVSFNIATKRYHRSQTPFLEMMAQRELIVHVMDPQSRRASQLPMLGAAIAKMEPRLLPVLTEAMGHGLDASAALESFAGN